MLERSRGSVLASAVLGIGIIGSSAHAANLYWDVNGVTTGLGGTGVWDTSTSSWATASSGTGAVAPWTNTSPAHVAYFRAASSVTLNSDSQNIDIGGINTGSSGSFATTIAAPVSGTAALNLIGNAGVSLGNYGSASLSITAPMTGTGGLNYNATIGLFGVVTAAVSGANTYAGDTALSNNGAGVLVFRAATDSVMSGSQIVSGSFGKGTLKLGANAQLTGGSGSGAVIIANPVSLDGNFRLGFSSSGFKGVRFDGPATLTGNRVITVEASSGQPTFAGAIGESAAGYSLTKSGNGSLTLQGINSYTGGTTVTAGTLTISSGGSLGSGPLAVNNPNTAAGSNVTANFNSAQTVGPLSGTIAVPSSGTNNATINLTGAATILSVKQTGSTVYAGLLAGTGGLTLADASTGLLSLTRANTYGGGTVVDGGALVANNTAGSATGTGAVAIHDGGTLGGAGFITGNVALHSGGHLAPGNSIGTLTLGTLSLGAGAILDYEFIATANDQAAVTGALSLGAAGLNLYEEGTSNPLTTPGVYTLFSYGSLSGLPAALAVLNPQPGFEYAFSDDPVLKQVQLTVAIPEPSLVGLAGMMGFAAARRRRSVR